MFRKSLVSLCALGALAGAASAQPVTPTALTGGTQGAYTVVDFFTPLSSASWFTFSLGAPTNVDIDINRLAAPPDLIATLYAGDITGQDATALGGTHGDIYFTSFGPMALVNWQDDTEDDAFGGPWGDPRFTLNLPAGSYSLVVTSLQGAGNPFEITSNVPEPTTLGLLALGGLAMLRRR